MQKSQPLISAIIPVYNGERYLGEALESIFSQAYESLEVIVVDDGSTDDSAKIANMFGKHIHYYYQPNSGLGAARNTGLERAKGQYIAFLDADDLWAENRLHRQMEAMSGTPQLGIVSGKIRQFISPECDEELSLKIVLQEKPIPSTVTTACLIRRFVFHQVGTFSTNWVVGTDLEWTLRARERGIKIESLPDLVLLRRIHKKNHGRIQKEFAVQRIQILKEALDRRRRMR